MAKAPAQFELKTKKKSSTFILLSQQYVMHLFHFIISNRTTVIKVSLNKTALLEYFNKDSNQFHKGGFRGNLETPLDLPLCML